MKLAVFCGSAQELPRQYEEAARLLGRTLAGRDISLVYGGTNLGLMGTLCDAVLEGGGAAIGVIPRILAELNTTHSGLTEKHVVDGLHARKAKMAELADGFITLPGGLGTMEEIFEQLSWGQLGLHGKPCGLLNIDGYFEHLLTFLDTMQERGFVAPRHRQMLLVAETPAELIDRMQTYEVPASKWGE